MNTRGFYLVAVLLLAAALTYVSAHEFEEEPWESYSDPSSRSSRDPNFPGPGGYGMPGGGYGIPGWAGGGIPGFPGGGFPGGGFPGGPGGNGWGNPGGGWGAGYGGPGGGYARGGIVRPSVVCRERGPCYGKKLTCPARCFSSYSHSGKNYGYGGGGGGCTMDCSKKCVAYC